MTEPIAETGEAIAVDPNVVVGPAATFDGLLAFWGLARVEGRVKGDVAAEGVLEVGPEAVVSARIEVDTLIVEGLVEGEVLARDRVEVRAGGRITASVRTAKLVLDEGGSLEGRLVMTSPRASGEDGSEAASAA